MSADPPYHNRPCLSRREALAATLGAGGLLLGGCSPAGLLNSVSGVLEGGGSRRAVGGVRYGALPRQALDVWVPSRRSAAPLPVVVFFYGGGWVSGDRTDYGFAGRAFASQGFVSVVPDYRLVPSVRFPAFVEDGAAAMRWVVENIARFGGDPGRISVSGHSAGAYIGAMLALDRRFLSAAGVDPAVIRAGALLAGPYDFYPFTEQRGRDALGAWPRPLETQPVSFARRDAPPLLLAHGTADTVVRPSNSQALAARLRSVGADVALQLYPGASHVDLVKSLAAPFRGSLPVLADGVRFLAQRVQ